MYVSLLERFQGWTIATVDNLTFDQLNTIYSVIAERNKETKLDDSDLKNSKIPTATITREEKEAWIKAGYPSPIKDFINKFRKDKT